MVIPFPCSGSRMRSNGCYTSWGTITHVGAINALAVIVTFRNINVAFRNIRKKFLDLLYIFD